MREGEKEGWGKGGKEGHRGKECSNLVRGKWR